MQMSPATKKEAITEGHRDSTADQYSQHQALFAGEKCVPTEYICIEVKAMQDSGANLCDDASHYGNCDYDPYSVWPWKT